MARAKQQNWDQKLFQIFSDMLDSQDEQKLSIACDL